MSNATERTTQLKTWAKRVFFWLLNRGNQLVNLLRHYGSWIGFLYRMAPSFVKRIPRLILRATDYISPITRIISGLKLLQNTLSTFQGPWTFALCFAGSLAGISLGIAAILYPTFGLIFALANMSCNAVLGFWFVALALKNKYRGSWKQQRDLGKKVENAFYSLLTVGNNLEKYKKFRKQEANASQDETNIRLAELEDLYLKQVDQNNQLNADLAIKFYNTGIILLTLSGLVLATFPGTLMLGVSLLLATSIHGVLFGYDLSGKWPDKVKNYFFGPRLPDSNIELDKKVVAYKQKCALSTITMQRAFQYSPKNEEALVEPSLQERIDTQQPRTNRDCCKLNLLWGKLFCQPPTKEPTFMPAETPDLIKRPEPAI